MMCRKNTEDRNLKFIKIKNGRIMILSKYAVCDSKKARFVEEQETSGLLSNLEIKKPLNKILLVGPLLL